MRYLVLLASDPTGWEQASAEVRQTYFDAHAAFERAVAARGSKVSGAALADADTATTIRHSGGQAIVSDGPFAELTEQVGGFYLVDLPDLDTAIAAGKLLPPSYAVEIRPVVEVEGYDPT